MNEEKTKQDMRKRFYRTKAKFVLLESKLANISLNDQQEKLLEEINTRLSKLYNDIRDVKILIDTKTGKIAGVQKDEIKLSLAEVKKECKNIEDMIDLVPIKKQRSAKLDKIFK